MKDKHLEWAILILAPFMLWLALPKYIEHMMDPNPAPERLNELVQPEVQDRSHSR